MNYSKTFGSVGLSALVLLGITWYNNDDVKVGTTASPASETQISVPVPETPISVPIVEAAIPTVPETPIPPVPETAIVVSA